MSYIKLKNYTNQEFRNLSLIFFIISGFLFVGLLVQILVVGGFDERIFSVLPQFILTLFKGLSDKTLK